MPLSPEKLREIETKPANFDVMANLPVYDENGNRVPNRWERVVAERTRKAEREARKAERRAGRPTAPERQAVSPFYTFLAVLLMIGFLLLIGLFLHAVSPASYAANH